MKHRLRNGITASALLLCPLAALAQVTNGSFETPAVPAASFTSFSSGSSFGGWNVIGPTGSQVSVVSGMFAQNGITFPAQSGAQWLDLTGFNSNAAEGVQQAIPTVPGSSYDVSFFIGNVVNPGGLFGTQSTVNVLANGSSIGSATNSAGSGTTLTWSPFTLHFTATSASTTLAFVNGDPGSDNSNGLDNISVALSTVVGPVPEPGTWALLASGLLALGGYARRRR